MGLPALTDTVSRQPGHEQYDRQNGSGPELSSQRCADTSAGTHAHRQCRTLPRWPPAGPASADIPAGESDLGRRTPEPLLLVSDRPRARPCVSSPGNAARGGPLTESRPSASSTPVPPDAGTEPETLRTDGMRIRRSRRTKMPIVAGHRAVGKVRAQLVGAQCEAAATRAEMGQTTGCQVALDGCDGVHQRTRNR